MQTKDTDYQADFLAALLSADANAVPSALPSQAAKRFRVYRNNVYAALTDALSDAYPVCKRLVGDEFFNAMAKVFFLGEATRQPSLALYGEGFADFIGDFEPASSVPYLADVARLERARLEAVHAADLPVLQTTDLPADGSQLVNQKLVMHPSMRLLVSPYPVFTIWHVNQPGGSGAHSAAGAERVLVSRPDDSIQLLLLDDAAVLFLRELMKGESIQSAYEATIDQFDDFDVIGNLVTLLGAGCFTQIKG